LLVFATREFVHFSECWGEKEALVALLLISMFCVLALENLPFYFGGEKLALSATSHNVYPNAHLYFANMKGSLMNMR